MNIYLNRYFQVSLFVDVYIFYHLILISKTKICRFGYISSDIETIQGLFLDELCMANNIMIGNQNYGKFHAYSFQTCKYTNLIRCMRWRSGLCHAPSSGPNDQTWVIWYIYVLVLEPVPEYNQHHCDTNTVIGKADLLRNQTPFYQWR